MKRMRALHSRLVRLQKGSSMLVLDQLVPQRPGDILGDNVISRR